MEAKDTVMKLSEELKPYHSADKYTVGDERIVVTEDIWEIPALLNAQAQITWDKAKEYFLAQGRREAAQDIGEALCCLAGNLMIDNKEAGTLLANQFQPVIDYIKTEYLPELKRKETCHEIINRQRQEGRKEVVESEIIQEFLWFADNVPCVSQLCGDVIEGCGCATCLAKKLKAQLADWGIKEAQ